MVDLIYNGETTVKERDSDDFLETLKEYKILKVKSNVETNSIRCMFYNCGFCRAGPDCMFDHPNEDCKSRMLGNVCRDQKYIKRHRKICQYTNSESGCARGSEFMFIHEGQKEKENNVKKDSKQKCDTCKFEKDKDQVKLHEVKEHRFMQCLNCDRNIELEILFTKNFETKDYLCVKFRNTSLKEIAKMVNY